MANNWYQMVVVCGEKDKLAPLKERILSGKKYRKYDPSEEYYDFYHTFYPSPFEAHDDSFNHGRCLIMGSFDKNYDKIPGFSKEILKALWKLFGGDEQNNESFMFFYIVLKTLYLKMKNWETVDVKIDLEQLEMGDTYIRFDYSTRWVPFDRFIFDISKEYPDLTFTFYFAEELIYDDLAGGFLYKNGEILSHWEESEEEYDRRVKELYGELPSNNS